MSVVDLKISCGAQTLRQSILAILALKDGSKPAHFLLMIIRNDLIEVCPSEDARQRVVRRIDDHQMTQMVVLELLERLRECVEAAKLDG